MTNLAIMFLAVAGVVATALLFARGYRAAGMGVGLLTLAGVLVYLLPTLVGWELDWRIDTVTLAIASFALLAVSLMARIPFFGMLGIVGLGLTACLVLGASWWVLGLTVLAALLAAFALRPGNTAVSNFMALMAVAALVASGLVAVNTTDENKLAAALGKQLRGNNALFTSRAEACKNPQGDLVWICAGFAQNDATDAAQDKAIAAIRNRLGIVELATTGVTIIGSPGGMTDDQAVKALAAQLAAAGWGPNDVRINNVDENLHKEQAGTARFNERLRTKARLVEYLNGSSPAQIANRNLVTSPVPTDQHERQLRGEGYYAVQFLQASCLQGNGFWKDGRVMLDGQRCHSAGDILWIYVGNDGRVYWGATVRDDCGNGHLDQAPTPKRRTPAGNGGGNRTPVCPAGTDHAGQPIGDKACSNPPPKKVPVCSLDGTKIIWVPPAEASKYPKPNANGTCTKENQGGNPGLNPGEGGSGGVNNNDGATDSTGLQNDPAADAAAAAAKAEAERKAAEEAAKKAAESASTDSGAGDTPQGPSSGSPTGNGGDQSGGVWGH